MAMHTELQIYAAAMGLLHMATNLTRNIPRDLKQQLGRRVIDECIDVLMLIARANSTRERRPIRGAGHEPVRLQPGATALHL